MNFQTKNILVQLKIFDSKMNIFTAYFWYYGVKYKFENLNVENMNLGQFYETHHFIH